VVKMINSTLATNLKTAGINAAIDHANQVHDQWSDHAYAMLCEYLADVRGDFMCEDVRAYAKLKGLPCPPTARAWGSVIDRAARASLITRKGYGKTHSPSAHRTPAAIWSVA
jgi:hypothetical protein